MLLFFNIGRQRYDFLTKCHSFHVFFESVKKKQKLPPNGIFYLLIIAAISYKPTFEHRRYGSREHLRIIVFIFLLPRQQKDLESPDKEYFSIEVIRMIRRFWISPE